jgi:hypothetical protein
MVIFWRDFSLEHSPYKDDMPKHGHLERVGRIAIRRLGRQEWRITPLAPIRPTRWVISELVKKNRATGVAGSSSIRRIGLRSAFGRSLLQSLNDGFQPTNFAIMPEVDHVIQARLNFEPKLNLFGADLKCAKPVRVHHLVKDSREVFLSDQDLQAGSASAF